MVCYDNKGVRMIDLTNITLEELKKEHERLDRILLGTHNKLTGYVNAAITWDMEREQLVRERGELLTAYHETIAEFQRLKGLAPSIQDVFYLDGVMSVITAKFDKCPK